METIRRFKKMSLWDFIELMEANCYNSGDKDTYFLYLDELRMRKIESVSEGGNYKLKSLALELKEKFLEEVKKSPGFALEEEMKDLEFIVNEITS
ncbi:MAG: hypothetical protein ACJAT2_001173 [Bacteriovoracaceae bacterium]|jgi:hypothetical protein